MDSTTLSPDGQARLAVRLPFNGEFFQMIHKGYFAHHGPLAISLCVLGIITNIISITVLLQKRMRTPTTVLLTARAMADILVMAIYIPFACHQYLLRDSMMSIDEWRGYSWMAYLVFTINITVFLHCVSSFLLVAIAVFRYITVSHPRSAQKLCSMPRAMAAVALIILVTAILSIPSYLSVEVNEHTDRELLDQVEPGTVLYRIEESAFSKSQFNLPRKTSFYLFSTAFKLLPSLVVIGLSIPIAMSLSKAGEQYIHMTRVLLVLFVIFVLAQLPSGLVALASSFSAKFFIHVYGPLGDLMDALALLTSDLTFVVFILLNPEFRLTLRELFTGRQTEDRFQRLDSTELKPRR